jgi:hypothetical protein
METALELGRQFEQEAILWIDNDELTLLFNPNLTEALSGLIRSNVPRRISTVPSMVLAILLESRTSSSLPTFVRRLAG